MYLKCRWHMRIVSMASGKWKQPKNVPKCLLFHLKTFVWKCYCESLVEDDKEVLKYILRNANHLKRANFSSKGIDFC
ncbi:unnamed protein product [Eruca vesicaria subsp. sativa]|uniref:FBD domain-containing protein n=1 Tax=Eruca vesicaria subsp. sativa TaxID=29727 RepID=A0ABC8LBM3_ERUVS|nr:unnamed protein product [Eruca vesicaria subsp. sativa]